MERGDYEFSWALTVHMDRDAQCALGSVGLALEDTQVQGICCTETLAMITLERQAAG